MYAGVCSEINHAMEGFKSNRRNSRFLRVSPEDTFARLGYTFLR